MTDIAAPDSAIQDFIQRWENSAAAERANYQLFLGELCVALGVPPPEPTQADGRRNAYAFKNNCTFRFTGCAFS